LKGDAAFHERLRKLRPAENEPHAREIAVFFSESYFSSLLAI